MSEAPRKITTRRDRRVQKGSAQGPTTSPGGGEGRRPFLTKWSVAGLGIVVTAVIGTLVQGVFNPLGALLGANVERFSVGDPVTVRSAWPAVGGCDDSVVAMPTGKDPDDIVFTFEEDPRVTASRQGAAAWETGALNLEVGIADGRTATIDDVSFTVLEKDTSPQLGWLLTNAASCGGGHGDRDYLALDLDTGDLAIANEDPAEPTRPVDLRGIRLTPDEPFKLNVRATGCEAFYTWRLVISYTIDGRQEQIRIGDDAQPLTVVGGVDNVPAFDIGNAQVAGKRVLTATSGPSSQVCDA